MRVLLDECVPRRLRRELPGLDVSHVSDLRWQGRRNGLLLLSMREAGFDALVTVDRNLSFQQNVPAAGLVVIVLHGVTNRVTDLRPLIPGLRRALETGRAGQVYHVTP